MDSGPGAAALSPTKGTLVTRSTGDRRTTRPQYRLAMQLLAVLLLLLGAGGSTYLGERPDVPATAGSVEQELLRRLVEADRRTDRGERLAPGNAVGEAAEQRASRADGPDASPPPPEPEPDPEPASGAPADPVGPIPASCDEFSGNRATGCALLLDAGFELAQMSCLDSLWTKESGWNHRAQNPSSGAYGIPQALPGSKMASHGDDWQTNPATQIRWGLSYISSRYGTPCAAWQFSQANGWY